MRDVYKDEEIGFASRFEKEAKASGPTQREKDLARALDEMAKVARKEQCKAKEAYQKGHDQAVVESAEVIRHLNSQITGYKGAVTQKDNVIAVQNNQIAEMAKVVDKVPELLAKIDDLLHTNNELKKENEKEKEMREEAEEVAYSALDQLQEKDKIIENKDKEIISLRKKLEEKEDNERLIKRILNR